MKLENNLLKVFEKIENAKNKCKSNEAVELVVATKNQTPQTLEKLASTKLVKTVGDNIVNQFRQNYNQSLPFNWQFIGRLQTNKVKYLVGNINLIQSVDRISLLEEIDKQSKKNNTITNALIEINICNDVQKGGILLEQTEDFLEKCLQYDNIKIQGLMAILPHTSNVSCLEKYCLQMREKYDKIKALNNDKCNIKYLSMGMSDDFEAAIMFGANMVRIGRAIFN